MIALPIRGGLYAWVDRDDFEKFAHFEWSYLGREGKKYVVRTPNKKYRDVGNTKIRLHREILRPAPDEVVDHIDGNTLNNLKSNLRICVQAQNVRNRQKTTSQTTSKYKGVHLAGKNPAKPWVAQIRTGKKIKYLGQFRTEVDAALAYDVAALFYHGEFARPNFAMRAIS